MNIEEAAKKLADTLEVSEPKGLVFHAFKKGAGWALAHQWHNIKNGDLPYKYKELIDENYDDFTLDVVCTDGCIYDTDYMLKTSDGWVWDRDFGYCYWMEIPSLP